MGRDSATKTVRVSTNRERISTTNQEYTPNRPPGQLLEERNKLNKPMVTNKQPNANEQLTRDSSNFFQTGPSGTHPMVVGRRSQGVAECI